MNSYQNLNFLRSLCSNDVLKNFCCGYSIEQVLKRWYKVLYHIIKGKNIFDCDRTLNNELEVSKLIDIMHELLIDHKYLTIIMDTLDTSLLHEKSINFNVIINHRGEGNYDH